MRPSEPFTMSKQDKENIISHTVNKYGEKLMAFIKPKVKSAEDAEDILQEVWFQLSTRTNIADIVNISKWLFSVTRNKITDKYRKKKTNHLEDYLYEDDDGETFIRDFLLMGANSTELKLFQDDIWDALMHALEELPDNQRMVFVENEFNNKTLQQIADEHGINLTTIISRKTYAVKHLRLKLKRLYQDLNTD